MNTPNVSRTRPEFEFLRDSVNEPSSSQRELECLSSFKNLSIAPIAPKPKPLKKEMSVVYRPRPIYVSL